MKKLSFLFLFLIVISQFVFAQNPVTIDIPALVTLGVSIFLAGIAGQPVMGLIAIVKRWFNATGIWVRVISVIVSAGCVTAYLIPVGWNWLHFVILTIVVTVSANGLHLANKRRNP